MNPLNSSELKDEIKTLLQDAMGDFPTEHLLQYHTDNLLALIAKHTQEARIDELESFYTAVPEASSDWIDQRIAALKPKTGDK